MSLDERSARDPYAAVGTAAGAALVAAGCFVGSVATDRLEFAQGGPAIVFPPYAVLTAALLLSPVKRWWIYLLAASAGCFLPHRAGAVTAHVLLCEVANYSKALIAAAAVRRFAGGPLRFDTLRGTGVFLLFAVAVGPAAAGFIGAASAVAFRGADSYWLTWGGWVLSNALTALTLLPVILTLLTPKAAPQSAPSAAAAAALTAAPTAQKPKAHPARVVEAGLLWAALLAVGLYVFASSPAHSWPLPPLLLYWVVPCLLWAAVRFGPAGTSAALLAVTVMAIGGALSGRGPFVGRTPGQNLLDLQLFLIVTSLPLLLLASLVREHRQTLRALRDTERDGRTRFAQLAAEVAERQKAEEAVRRSEQKYRDVVENQTDMVCCYLADTTLTFVNDAYCRNFGRKREELIGRPFLEFIPAPARKAALDHVRAVIQAPRATQYEHEVTRPDGTTGWQQWVDHVIRGSGSEAAELQGIGRDVTDRRRAEAALRTSYARVQELAGSLIAAQEAERTRIARELHDDINQQLAAMAISLSTLKRKLPDAAAREELAELQQRAVELADAVRNLSHELHPGVLRHVGLAAAITSYCADFRGRHGIPVDVRAGELGALPEDVSLCLYRVAQEALGNVVRHSGARRAEVAMGRSAGGVELVVSDDGCGFDAAAAPLAGGLGLISIDERVRLARGTVTIEAAPGRGTRMRVWVPLGERPDASRDSAACG